MPVTLNGRTWQLNDFAPWGFAKNWMPFFEDLGAELSLFQDSSAGGQTAASAASARSAATAAQTAQGAAGTGAATGLVIPAASRSLVTATDVVASFVYDTRLDSDGGAWTEKCRGTSWYNEALNTATRGATRRFPTVALIVARVGSVTIYDAHDLDAGGVPRMWMVFNTNASATQALYAGGGIALTSVFACNGRVLVTSSTAGIGGLTEINFPSDRSSVRRDSLDVAFNDCKSLINRNTAHPTGGFLARLVDDDCTAVHARVLPGAPLDRLGLPIPTVAVATTGGISVIHPWGAVVDITDASGHEKVQFIGPDRLMTVFRSNPTLTEVGPVPYADVTSAAWRQALYSGPAVSGALKFPADGRVSSITPQAQGTNAGLRFLAEDTANPANGMAAYATTTYATGWMPGDIRGAYLCDTAAGSITGSMELVTNGDFSGSTTGWTPVNATVSVVSGAMRVTATSTTYPQAQQAITTVPGQTYLLSFDVAAGAAGPAGILVGTTAGFAQIGVAVGVIGGRTYFQFVATGTTTWLSTQHGSLTAGQVADYDNISVKLIVPDRSHKGRGLLVNGVLTRTGLPCGLSAVSGFAATNYLEQPYNADLDFGSGDWSIAFWINLPVAGGFYAERAWWTAGAYSGPRINISTPGSDLLRLTLTDGTNAAAVTSTATVAGGWRQVIFTCRADVLEMWVDGVLQGTASLSAIGSLTNNNAITRIGLTQNGQVSSNTTALCLWRISAYAPTPAQIRRMWADERALMITGTQATLGGASNNVTALSANDANGTLAVGTGDGVSLFSGLGRVSYLDGVSAGAAIGSDAITALSASGPQLLVATSANVGLISDNLLARDRLPATAAVPVAAPMATDPHLYTARCVTLDATATSMVPRIHVGERQSLVMEVTIQVRSYGAGTPIVGDFRRIARFVRDAGGNVTLAGTVQTIGTDQNNAAGLAATFAIDTNAQTVTPSVTGLAATRLVWTARVAVQRISEETSYAAQ